MGNCETCQGCEGRLSEVKENNIESYSFIKDSDESDGEGKSNKKVILINLLVKK